MSSIVLRDRSTTLSGLSIPRTIRSRAAATRPAGLRSDGFAGPERRAPAAPPSLEEPLRPPLLAIGIRPIFIEQPNSRPNRPPRLDRDPTGGDAAAGRPAPRTGARDARTARGEGAR